MLLFLTEISPFIKTPTRGSMYGRRVTRSAVTPTLSPIASTLAAAAVTAIASASI